jgi:hypothetical protein
MNHKSSNQSINQHIPHHNRHTKNSLHSPHKKQEYPSRQIMQPYQSFYGRFEPMECIYGTYFIIQEPPINSTIDLQDLIHYMHPILIQLAYVRALAQRSPHIPHKIGFMNFRDFYRHDLRLAETLMCSWDPPENLSLRIYLQSCLRYLHLSFLSQETLASYWHSSSSRSLNPHLGHFIILGLITFHK